MAANYARHPHAKQMLAACSTSKLDVLIVAKKAAQERLDKVRYRHWLLATPTKEMLTQRDRMMRQWGEIFNA